MNAFKLDLMTVLALFVILAVIVTMALGANDDERTSVGAFNQPKNTFGTAIDTTSVSRTSQTVLPSSQFVSRSWH